MKGLLGISWLMWALDELTDTQKVLVLNSSDANVLDCSAVATKTSIQISPESFLPMRGRKRRWDVQKWKDTQRKKALNLGEEYISRKGKVMERKKIKEGCGPQCRMKCQQRITMEERETVFHLFWRTGNIDMRRVYVCHNAETKETLVCKNDSGRKRSLKYQLELEGGKILVCKTFFLHTHSQLQTSWSSRHWQRKMKVAIWLQMEEKGNLNKHPLWMKREIEWKLTSNNFQP